MSPAGKVYVVGTPIGNLGDISYRAVDILKSVAVIACEDTRVTKRLLNHYRITTPTTSLHQHSSDAKIRELIESLQAGHDIAVVTDAGTPGIADPGGKFVHQAIEQGIEVISIPGPSAVAAALSISGFPTDRFVFLGFLPHKKGRQTLFQRIAETEETVVLYESPHRLLKTLESLMTLIVNKPIAVCRELTKVHESVVRGSATEVKKYFDEHPDQVRGEIAIVIGPQ